MRAVISHQRGPEHYRLVAQTDGRYRLEDGDVFRADGPKISFLNADAAYRRLRSWGIPEGTILLVPGLEKFAAVPDEPAAD